MNRPFTPQPHEQDDQDSPESVRSFLTRLPLLTLSLVGGGILALALLTYVLVTQALVARLPQESLPLALGFVLLAVPVAVVALAMGMRQRRQHHRLKRQLAVLAARFERHLGNDSNRSLTPAGDEPGLKVLEGALIRLTSLRDSANSMLLDRDAQLATMRSLGGVAYWETDFFGRYTRLEMPARGRRPELAQLLGQTRWDDGASIAAGQAADWDAHREMLRRCDSFTDLVVRRRDASGNWFDLWEAGEPRFGADGELAGYRGVFVDLELSGQTQALRDDTAARLLELEVSTRELESFSYTVSHDLRAPLRSVEGFARIVQEDYGQSLDRTGQEHLGRIQAAAQRMNGMIDALLALARLSERPVTAEDVDLSRCAIEVVEELRAGDRDRQLTIDVEPGLRARGDRLLLRLVLQNLLGNAWKYTSRRHDARVSLSAQRHGGQTVFQVIDNGVGFDMRFSDRLFSVFQRLHSASEFPGTGIGLATAQRIVRRHDGRIWAYSEPDRGAAFYFTLWERRTGPRPPG